MSELRSNKITDVAGTASPNIPGAIINVKSASYTDVISLTTDSRTDVPNLSLTITPSSVNSKILVMAFISYGSTDANNYGSGYLMRDSIDIGVGTTATGNRQNCSFAMNLTGYTNEIYKLDTSSMTFLDSPSTTSSITYKVQARHDINGTMYINRSGSDADADYGLRGISTLTIMEIGG